MPVPRSPVQVMVAIDQEQREELEAMIRYNACKGILNLSIIICFYLHVLECKQFLKCLWVSPSVIFKKKIPTNN